MCSSYAKNISWSSWTSVAALGSGTLMTNDGVPNCGQGTWTAHPGYQVTLSNPKTVAYCAGSTSATGLLFTQTDVWDFPIPDIAPC